MAIEIISSKSLSDNELSEKFKNIYLNSKNVIHLCATQSVKELRTSESKLIPYYSTKVNIQTFSEFIKNIQNKIYQNKLCIKTSDQRYILKKVIDYLFSNKDIHSLMDSMRYKIFKLCEFLRFNNIAISNTSLDLIKNDCSDFEYNLFNVCKEFNTVMDELESENISHRTNQILGTDINIKKNIKSVGTMTKESINQIISETGIIILDGFLFFTDMQKYIIQTSANLGKKVYLTAKLNNKITDKYLTEHIFKTLFNDLKQPYIAPKSNILEKNNLTSINLLKNEYPNIFKIKSIIERHNHIKDETIKIIQPFSNRELEWQFIVQEISSKLEKTCKDDEDKIKACLSNDIALIVTKDGYEERVSAILKEIGVFIFKGEEYIDNIKFKDKIIPNFKRVYYRKNDFLSLEIKFQSGKCLSYQEKSLLFEETFEGIKLGRNFFRPLASYPAVQYILEIYSILLDGININRFKNILSSNWQHNVNDGVKWDQYLEAFKCIEMFFKDNDSISSWIDTLNILISFKNKSLADPLLKYHPLRKVNIESLNFIKDLLTSLSLLVEKLEGISGGIKDHINALQSSLLGNTKMEVHEEEQTEKFIISLLLDALNKMDSPIINNISTTYFAKNIRTMIKDIESDIELKSKSKLILNIVNLENMKKFKTCFFPMNEIDNYPRKYIKDFPFNSEEVINILTSKKYGICKRPSDLLGEDVHCLFEQYLFKNVLDYTQEELIITRTEKEDNKKKSPSIYIRDICLAFGIDNNFESVNHTESKSNLNFSKSRIPNKIIKSKPNYTLDELATFELCPRLYYHQRESQELFYCTKHQMQFYFIAVLFCGTVNKFVSYSEENNKLYFSENNEAIQICLLLFEEIYAEYLPIFNIFTEYELKDIRKVIIEKLNGLIKNTIERFIKKASESSSSNKKSVPSFYFKVSFPHKERLHKGYNYELTLNFDLKVTNTNDNSSYISQNNLYIEFLVLKTLEDSKEQLKHYTDMIEALSENKPNCDRINLVMKIINKINIQFDSIRFAGDGIKRTDNLVRKIEGYKFSVPRAMPSKFCAYCKLGETCKARFVKI